MLSIIIPVYNVQNYIVKCLGTVASQTYVGAMECLIIDDCGSDDSILRAESFIKEYDGKIDFRIIHHECNKGLSEARNTGLREAKGDYIGFIDSDDWIEPTMYEDLARRMASDPNALFITSSIIGETPNGIVNGFANSDKYVENGFLTPYHFLELMISGQTNNAVWNKLYRKSFFKNAFQKGKICEDYLFFFDNCINQKDGHILTTPKSYYHYLVRDGSISNQPKQSKNQSWFDWMENMIYVADESKKIAPELFHLQVLRFNDRFTGYFESILFNQAITAKRKKSLMNINRYARNICRPDLPKMKRLDMYIATHIPLGYGYTIDRFFITFRRKLSPVVQYMR